MKNELTRHDIAVRKDVRRDVRINVWTASRCVRLGLVGSLGASMALLLADHTPRAQQRYTEPSVRVTSVTTSGNVVSISADGSLGRAQTWQDPEGFHVVLVNGQAGAGASGAGIKTRRIGNSLELVVPVRRGASVTVEPRGNRLDLVLSGGQSGALNVENFPVEQRNDAQARAHAAETHERESEPREREEFSDSQPAQHRHNQSEPSQSSSQQQQQSYSPQQFSVPPSSTKPAQQTAAQTQGAEAAPSEAAAPSVAQQSAAQTLPEHENTGVPAAPAQLVTEDSGSGFLSLMTSLPALFCLLGAALFGGLLILLRRRRARSEFEDGSEGESSKRKSRASASADEEDAAKSFKHSGGERRRSSVAVPFERRKSSRGAEDEAMRRRIDTESKNAEDGERALELRPANHAPAPLVEFGAYRIDQEVAALVQGKPHSVEVIASRAADDRRAVETSLLKSLRAADVDADGRRRARTALEDYGFVARSCASLLLGSESFERASAARSLGEMRSSQALPFLTEALYDQDSVVRNECVQGLGALGLPSAIGALLDVARRYPELSASVVGPALTACSVESLELSWDSTLDSRTFSEGAGGEESSRETVALVVAESYEELPEFIEDMTLASALESAESEYAETRVGAAQHLAQFQVKRAVEALNALARRDSEPAVRSAAVTSLGLINHESVFVAVIAALADEAREVRAAAARAMSRLSFDRADAYVRVIESADAEALRDVAQAAVKAGLAAQAISRLASEDRRQAYEAFSLLTLCAKAGEVQPILDTVECHRDIEVRLTCIRLLGLSIRPELGEHLMRIASNGGVPERVRRAIVETVKSADRPVEGEAQPVEVTAQPVEVGAQSVEIQPVEVE
jgi:HEAT repeat protein